jgi:hypothetical protein
MHAMSTDSSAESTQFRVTLFVGPQPVEGKPFTYSTVFNVKKRSWKGGVQVEVEIDQPQIDAVISATGFPHWLTEILLTVPLEDRSSYRDRGQELFIQAICWCKLDLLLQSGIMQENQCLKVDRFVEELRTSVTTRQEFITSHVASELDLLPNDTTLSP